MRWDVNEMTEATSKGLQKSEENQVVWFVPIGVYHNYNEIYYPNLLYI